MIAHLVQIYSFKNMTVSINIQIQLKFNFCARNTKWLYAHVRLPCKPHRLIHNSLGFDYLQVSPTHEHFHRHRHVPSRVRPVVIMHCENNHQLPTVQHRNLEQIHCIVDACKCMSYGKFLTSLTPTQTGWQDKPWTTLRGT